MDGHSTILIRSSDTDVEVLAVHYQSQIQSRLVLVTGTNDRSRIINIPDICDNLGECIALPGLHATAGCDSVSSFAGKGQKKAFELMCSNEKLWSNIQILGINLQMTVSDLSS